MHLRSRAALTIAGASMLTGLLAPVAAQAASYTSTGLRCTIVGTAKNDVLTGTAKRDVICGRGGDDRIQGRGGHDVLDAGAGTDVVVGGAGNDVVLGGAGDDTVVAGEGNDRVLAGTGADSIVAGDGKDLLRGGAGDDELDGGPGDDAVNGDAGADVTSGGSGDDTVTGGAGDDELGGDSGADDVDGGTGFNVCDTPNDDGDTQVRCATDTTPPAVTDVVATPSTVDVTESEQTVRIQMRITDDTGIARVGAGSWARLVSGTVRDGVWESEIAVPQFAEPGVRDLTISAYDRIGRSIHHPAAGLYTVVNTIVDQQRPVLQSMNLDRSAVDVQTEAQAITATVRLTDDLAGAGWVFLCAAHAWPTGEPAFRSLSPCEYMTRISGTALDGVWRATYTVPAGAPSGTWNFGVRVYDATDTSKIDYWLGPDEFAAHASLPAPLPDTHLLPDGAGVVTVTGAPQDVDPPVLTSVRLSPSVVDTSGGAVRVTVDIAGTDARGITDASLSINGPPGYPNHPDWGDLVHVAWVRDFSLHEGSPQDGVWRASFVVPGGTPDGSYFMQVSLRDDSHFESWMNPERGFSGDHIHALTPTLAPTGMYFVVQNS